MRALHLGTRFAGTDGVSLEAEKVAWALGTLGLEPFFCAGEVSKERTAAANTFCLPAMHFEDPAAAALGARMFGGGEDEGLRRDLRAAAVALADDLMEVVTTVRPDLLVIQNAWAIPMQLPLAEALALVATRTGLPCLSHEHDYFWERERFAAYADPAFLDTFFPFHAPNVRHLCINTPARRALHERRGLEARVLPNVMDFAHPAPGVDAYNADFREAIGLSEAHTLFLQPTRVVPRKGIELAIDLLAELADPAHVLVVTHRAGDEGLAYLRHLEAYAAVKRVELRYVAERVDESRRVEGDTKIYALSDIYPHADFVTYPSLYEGFGNALLETVYFRKPAFVNRYRVFETDIAPKGFRFVEISGAVTPEAVRAVAQLLEDPEAHREMVEHNYALALEHFSYDALKDVLAAEVAALGLSPVLGDPFGPPIPTAQGVHPHFRKRV
ncbi:glycosyltransferase family 4 protein [Truepera radiovictrix]|uniref:Glycosyl transferase group 1 n=1 Tax=Truepera radiovictrix (strain DSM 17093 / CIP 108686 / LMG 22925 / RQ-24) TaxID=649638 RepID=D7CUU2_TRURR|nr:glycosyltransferase family 4 protein [Truepera radiovictrix]ADI14083.1 glycosyl transferase group 1 [Truepera radiovictrix DSM 17093]WMT57355.1 glycosyltransferase family 4 protein [Truepera radiovictrix]